MMRALKKLPLFIVGLMILVGLYAVPIWAQDEDASYVPIKRADKKRRTTTTTTTTTRRPRRPNRTQKSNERAKVVRTPRAPRTSTLRVTTQPGAEVTLVPSVASVKAPNPLTVSGNGVVVFEDLKVIEYKIVVKLDGYETLEQDSVKMQAQTTLGINLELKPITYDLRIELNVADGEVRFAPAVVTGTSAEGKFLTRETGGYCVVKIENKKAVIPGLKKGFYNLDIRPAAVEYQPLKVAVNVPEDILDEEDEDENAETSQLDSYELELQKKISTEQFSSAWTSSEWDLPTGWRLQNKMQNNSLAGIALPRSEQYRYYVDFEMMSNVTLLDGDTVGFVFRAENTQNYYLVQISGARAAEPYRVKGFVVKKGVPTQIFTNPIEHLGEIIKKQFGFIIRSEKNKFKFYIHDTATGDDRELGNMVDPYDNFKKGAVGIAGSANSKFEVVSFTVICRGVCR